MQFFIIVLVICLVIFLFSLYTFAHDDFILLRRNVSLENVFNSAILTALSSLLLARIFYVLMHTKPVFLNPLGFILFPYFPGLSIVGGVMGGVLFLLFQARKRSYPVGRVFDFFSIAFLSAMPFGFLGYIFLAKYYSPLVFSQLFIFLLIFLISILLLLPRFVKSGREDGVIGFIFLISFCMVYLISGFITKSVFRITGFESILLLIMLIPSIVLLLRQLLKNKIKIIK